jgi:hypothetical protein
MNTMLEVDSLLCEAERAGVSVKLKVGGGVRVGGGSLTVGVWIDRLRPIKQDVVAYLELAALVAHYCAAIKSQLGKPYAPDDAQELLHGACQQPAAARAEIVAYMRREAGRLGKPFAPLSGDAINDKREG